MRPRSPVRRNGPLPSAVRAANVYVDCEGRFQYPAADARPADPDLADRAVRAGTMACRIDDDDRCPEVGAATGDAGFAAGGPRRRRSARRAGAVAAARHEQGSLGQAVAWPECGRPKAALGERGGEPFQGFPPDRFRPVVGVAPATEIQGCALLGPDPANAQVVGEVRGAAASRPVSGNRSQPPERSLQESGRRHQIGRTPAVDRLQDAVDQPHVVDDREPRYRHRGPVVSGLPARVGEVVQQVAVADHHAPRRIGRAGRVLQKGQRARGRGVAPCRRGRRVERVGSDPGRGVASLPPVRETRAVRRGPAGRRPRPPPHRLARAQDDFRPRVVRDREGPRQVSVGKPPPRREGRNRHDPRVQTSEERRDELQTGRVQQQRPGARRHAAAELGGDRPAAAVELGVTHAVALVLAVAQEDERPVVGLHPGPEPQQLDQ